VSDNNKMKLFEDKEIREEWNEDEQDWYVSIVDVIEVLTSQPSHDGARKYWSVMKTRMRKEGNELTTICSQLKMKSADGKDYRTDVANMSLSPLCIHKMRISMFTLHSKTSLSR